MPVSRFKYLTPAELVEFDLSLGAVTNEATAVKHIGAAERVIDSVVGRWPRFYTPESFTPTLVSGTTLEAAVFEREPVGYYSAGGLYVIGIEGPGAGEARLISGHTASGRVVLESAFTETPTSASTLVLRQRSVFPRCQDVYRAGKLRPFILEAVKEAVAAQVSYGVSLGSEAFSLWDPDVITDEDGDVVSRTYGSGYTEARDTKRRQGLAALTAPIARSILAGAGLLRSWGKG